MPSQDNRKNFADSDESDEESTEFLRRKRREKDDDDDSFKRDSHRSPPRSSTNEPSNLQKRKRNSDDKLPSSPQNSALSPKHDDQSVKKRKVENEDESDGEQSDASKTNQLIILLGEEGHYDNTSSNNNMVIAMRQVASTICRDLEEDYQTHINSITDILLQCVTDFPVKTSFYGTVVGLVNTKIAKFGEYIIQLTNEHIVQSHNHYDWIRLKALMRFVCELVHSKVIPDADAFVIFDYFFDLAIKYSQDIIGMNYMFVILGALPWGIELFKQNASYLSTITSKLGNYFDVYNTFDFSLYKVFKGQRDTLSVMWEQFQSILSENSDITEIKSLLKPYLLFNDSELSDTNSHRMELLYDMIVNIGFEDDGMSRGCIFKGRLGLYEEMLSKDLHLLSPIDRLIIEEYIIDLLYFFNASHRDCVNRLYYLAFSLATKAFRRENKGEEPKTLEEKEQALLNNNDTSVGEYFEHMAIDVILGTMCLLPNPPVKIHFYNVVIIGLCLQKCTEDNFSREIVKKYINYVFEKMDIFDDECCMLRFTSLMSYYLSHFDCKWDWNKWSFVLSSDAPVNKKREQFIRLVLQRTFHVTYMNKVKRSIKGSSDLTEDKFEDDYRESVDEDLSNVPFAKFLPTTPDIVFKYSKTSPHYDDANKILDAIRDNKDSNHMMELTSKLGCAENKVLLLDLLISCILFASSQKNLTDFCDIISNYREVIKSLIEYDTIQQRVNIVRSVWNFWKKSPQRIILFLKKLLLQHDILNTQSVVNYLLTDKDDIFSYSYTWDILRSSIDAQVVRALRAYEHGDDQISTSDLIPKVKKFSEEAKENQPASSSTAEPSTAEPSVDKMDETEEEKLPKGVESMTFKSLLGEIRETVYIMTRLLVERMLTFNDTTSWEFAYVSGLLREIARLYQCYVNDFTGFVQFVLTDSDNTVVREYLNTLFNGSTFFKKASIFVPGGFRATVPRYDRRFNKLPTIKNYTILDARNSIHDMLVKETKRVETEIPIANTITKDHPLCSPVLRQEETSVDAQTQ